MKIKDRENKRILITNFKSSQKRKQRNIEEIIQGNSPELKKDTDHEI